MKIFLFICLSLFGCETLPSENPPPEPEACEDAENTADCQQNYIDDMEFCANEGDPNDMHPCGQKAADDLAICLACL